LIDEKPSDARRRRRARIERNRRRCGGGTPTLNHYENQVHESIDKKLVQERRQARAKQAKEERKGRDFDRIVASWTRRPPLRLANKKSAGTNTRPPSDISILSGVALREAKERLLSRLLNRPDLCRCVERDGITRDHFSADPNWQQAFDMVRSGADIQALVLKDPTCETARLWGLAAQMSTSTSSLALQIVASVRAEGAAAMVAETTLEPSTDDVPTETANEPVVLTEVTAEFDYARVLPDYLPLLVELDKLRTAEQKRFDVIPAQIAFERECLALKLHDLSSDPVEGECEESVGAGEADQPAIGAAPQPPHIAVATAISSTMVTPVAAASSPLLLESRLPDTQDENSSEVVDSACGPLPSTDKTPASEPSTAVSPVAMLQAAEDSLRPRMQPATSAVAAPEAGAFARDNTDPLTKLSQA
jgi:hypothetical protein